MIWSASHVLSLSCSASQSSTDVIYSRWPALPKPLAFVFLTKVVVLVFSLSVYSLWLLYRVDKEIERRNPTPPAAFSRQDVYDADTIKTSPMSRAYSFAVTTNGQDPPESPQPK